MTASPQIARIDTMAWDIPMRAPYRSAQRITTTAHNALVVVTLTDGTRGLGESAPATYVTGETQSSVLAALMDFTPQLLGQEPQHAAATVAASLSEYPGARGALETALLDAAARSSGLPLFQILGGRQDALTRHTTDISLPLLPAQEAADRATHFAHEGFRAIKIKVGSSNLAEDTERVRAIADAAPQAMLRLDGNQGFIPSDAVTFVHNLKDLTPRIELFEQPTLAGDDAAMAFVQQRIPCPVFADEAVHNAADARRLIEGNICGGVVLKLAKSGIHEAMAIAQAAHAAGGKCLFGCMMETRIGITAALHLVIALGNNIVPLLDLDGHLLVNDEALLTGGLTQHEDVLSVNAAIPGLGIALRTV